MSKRKYTADELNILHAYGKRGLALFHKDYRKPIFMGKSQLIIESRKYKQKHKYDEVRDYEEL